VAEPLVLLRTRLDFLLLHSMILRGESSRTVELSDLCAVRLLNEGDMACPAVVMRITTGKTITLKDGGSSRKTHYSGFLRHRDVLLCPVAALAAGITGRWRPRISSASLDNTCGHSPALVQRPAATSLNAPPSPRRRTGFCDRSSPRWTPPPRVTACLFTRRRGPAADLPGPTALETARLQSSRMTRLRRSRSSLSRGGRRACRRADKGRGACHYGGNARRHQ
jgi:hypothetical protein